MKESDIVATMTMKFVVEGATVAEVAVNTLTEAQQKQVASALALANQTDALARRQASAAAAFDAWSRKGDPVVRAMAELEKNQNIYNRALANNASITDRAGQGLDHYLGKINEQKAAVDALIRQQETLRRQQSNMTTDTSANHVSSTAVTPSNTLEAEQRRLTDSMIAYKAALDAGKISQAAFDAKQEKSQQTLVEYENWLNKTTRSVESLNNETANVSVPQQPSTTSPVNNAFEAEQKRLAERMVVYKAALDAEKISQAAFDSEVEKSKQILIDYGNWLNKTTRSVESLNNQTAKVSTPQQQPSTNPTQITGAQLNNVNVREYAAQVEAAAKAQDDMTAAAARLRAALDPLGTEEQKVAERLSVLKGALDATMITQDQFGAAVTHENQGLAALAEKLNVAAVAAENLRRQQANASVNQGQGFNPASANTSTYATQFEAAAAAQDAMTASMARLRAELNPFETEQGRLGVQMASYKAALDAGRMSLAVYTAEQEKAGAALAVYAEKLKSAEVAAENLRRQQSNLSTNTTVAGPTNPTQITGVKLSNVDVREYAAQFEAAAKAQDDMAAAAIRLKAALNPLAAEEAKQVAELKLLKDAQVAGIITAEQFAGAQQLTATRLANLSQSLKTVGTAGRVASGEMTNLGFQLNDVVTGLFLGQSAFMIIGQQGGQLVQIFANSKNSIADFARASVTWLGSLLTPMNLLIAGAVAASAVVLKLAADYDKMQISARRAIDGAGARTGTTTTDINAFVDKNTPSAFSGSTLSQKESRLLGEELTKTGDIVISKLNSMSAAVVGFSNQTGQSMDEAVKAFAKMASNPVSALDELAKAFGPFSQETRTLVQDMVAAGDKTLAWNAILRELGPTAKNTAGNLGGAEAAFRGVINALQTAPAPSGLEKQLEDVRGKLNAAIESANKFAEQGLAAPPGLSNVIALLSKTFEELYAREQAVIGLKVSAVFDDIAEKARSATEALIPQIPLLKQMEQRLNELKAARDNGSGGPNNDAAITAQQNLIAKTQEAQAEAARYNEQVAKVSQSWGQVGQATALSLQALQNQLPLAQAVTGAAQMTAQAYLTVNTLLDQGKTLIEAQAIAAKQYELAQAAATASVQRQTDALKDSNDLLKVQGTSAEKLVAQRIAYNNAIKSGADEASAAALSLETARTYTIRGAAAALEWQQNMLGVSAAADSAAASSVQAAEAFEKAARASQGIWFGRGGDFGNFDVPHGTQFTSNGGASVGMVNGITVPLSDYNNYYGASGSTQRASDTAGQLLASGDIQGAYDAALKAGTISQGSSFNPAYSLDPYSGANFGAPNPSAPIGILDSITATLNAQTTDKATQDANNRREITELMKLPGSLEQQKRIAELTNAINGLTTSTNTLNRTNQDLLSPYYTMDPRTSHIGFRSQGMASGGSFIVPGGYSSNDNMIGQIPLASGEQVTVNRPADGGTSQIVIHQTNIFQGSANKDEVGRTMYQNGQSLARQLRATA